MIVTHSKGLKDARKPKSLKDMEEFLEGWWAVTALDKQGAYEQHENCH